MDEDPSRKVSWFHRPRRPRAILSDDLLVWRLALVWLCVVLVGLGMVVFEDGVGVKAGGFLTILLSSAVFAWFVAYMRRPVGWPDAGARSAMHRAAADSWAATLDRHGHVEVALNKRKAVRAFAGIVFMLLLAGFLIFAGVADPVAGVLGVVGLAMAVFLALLPHLEVATAGGPALRVDSRGIKIARWFPLEIPWTKVLAVRAHASSPSTTNVVVAVDDEFYAEYQASRPFPLRITDAVNRMFVGYGFAIPATIVADPEALAVWLDREARLRNHESDYTVRHRRADTEETN